MTPFEELAPESKVWIYTAEREFTTEEANYIQSKANAFIAEWESHGKSVKGLIEIRYNRFILIYADDEGDTLCGRAMDSSVRFVKELEQELGISLMDRMLIAYKEADKIITTPLPDFQTKIATGSINGDTLVFNNLLQQKSQVSSQWEVTAKESWHKQLLN